MEKYPLDNENNASENSESEAILKLRDYFLKNQWEVFTTPNFSINPTPKYATPIRPFNENSYIYVSSEKQLEHIWPEIFKEDILGIDIEQTFHQSYFGYICLIQISTSLQDFILDISSLKQIIRPFLKEIFENRDKIKIFYAGDNDLSWLQRDFSLFVKNYFDVKAAALFLNKTMDCSLANLIDIFCEKGKMDKKQKKILQLSPWWQRPLTEEQKNYAALDSHYLIVLREKLLQEIFEKQKDCKQIMKFFLKLEESTQKVYKAKEFNKCEYYQLFIKMTKTIKQAIKQEKDKEEEKKSENEKSCHEKRFFFIKIAELRDIKAREKDCGVEDLCSNSLLFEIAYNYIQVESLTQSENAFIKENRDKIKEILAVSKEDIEDEISKILISSKKNNNLEKAKRKQERLKQIEDLFLRKTPAYENCSILAPDGFLLCHCDQKKINWYLARKLAVPVTPDNRTIKLNFEPQGRGFSELEFIDHKFYTMDRSNQCVVCGNKEKYLKYHIVPLLYRQHFPNSFKSHRSHDVVLLCLECHEQASRETEKLKQELAIKFNVPINANSNPLLILRNKMLTMAKFGISFWKNKEKLPKERKQFLKKELRNMFEEIKMEEKVKKIIDLSQIELDNNKNNLVKINEKFFTMCKGFNKNHKNLKETSNKDFKNLHGKLVVEQLLNNQDLKEFILLWRKHFVDKLQPKFLPAAWNVYHQFERKFGDFSKFHEDYPEKYKNYKKNE